MKAEVLQRLIRNQMHESACGCEPRRFSRAEFVKGFQRMAARGMPMPGEMEMRQIRNALAECIALSITVGSCIIYLL